MNPSNEFRKHRHFTNINTVLGKVIVDLGLDRRLKEHSFMNLWPVLAGSQFSEKSRPLFMDYKGCLVVAVKDASVAQELSLAKSNLLKLLRRSGESLGVWVSGIRFDLKRFYEDTPIQSLQYNRHYSQELNSENDPRHGQLPSEQELNSLTLNQEEQDQLKTLQSGLKDWENHMLEAKGILPQANETTENSYSNRIMKLVERQIRTQRWKVEHDLPLCSRCKTGYFNLRPDSTWCTACSNNSEATIK